MIPNFEELAEIILKCRNIQIVATLLKGIYEEGKEMGRKIEKQNEQHWSKETR